MAEIQSTDGSLFSRETDEEKSLETTEDGVSLIAESGKEIDKIGGRGSVGNEESDKEDISRVEQSRTNYNSGNKGDETDDIDKGSTSDANEVGKDKKKKSETKSYHRDESTLAAIERYLKSGDCFGDTLEYEDVSTFNSKIHRYAVERTRARQGMYFRDETIQKLDDANLNIDPIILTEIDIAQERMYHQIYQKEEYFAVATKFFKTVLDGAHGTCGPDFDLHTKTASWLKRAAGMQRQYDPYEKDDNPKQRKGAYSEDSDDGGAEASVGGAFSGNDRRVTRRRVQMTRTKRRQERIEKESENFRVLSEVALDLSKQSRIGWRKKGARSWFTINDTTDDDDDTRIVDTVPMEIDPTSDKRFPSLDTTGLTTIYNPNFRGANGEGESSRGDEEESHEMESSILPPAVAKLGLEFRTRPIRLKKTCKTSISERGVDQRVTDRSRYQKSRALMNALSNKRTRCWAMHEFFYSDLDKEWYRDDGFASDLAKHGFPIDAQTRLTRQEWSLIRQKLRPRPRIFSKRFIADELKRRNRHRALVRSLQQDPKVKKFVPIAPGTPVNAFDKCRHTIRRGRVLLHDPQKHCYLVQFDDNDAGCDVCPDSEVAVSLPPTTRNVPSHSSLYEPHEKFLGSKVETNNLVEVGIAEDAVSSDGCMKGIERELLISSVTIVTEAFERKKTILEALESYVDSSGENASKNCSRLLANLNRVNTTLESALSYLQVLYGRVYASSKTKHEKENTSVERMELSGKIPKSKEFKDLVVSLISVSEAVGEAAICCGDDEARSKFASSKLLHEDLSNSISLLLLSNYLTETTSMLASLGTETTTYSNSMNAALKTLFDRYSKSCLPQIQETLQAAKKLEQESRIEEELKDLSFAVGMLRTEATLATDESRTFELSNAAV